MKILRTIVIAMLVMMLGMSAAFAANIEDIASSIEWNIGFGKYPVALDWKWHYMTQTPCTEAEWEEACALAIQRAKADGSWERMDPWGEAEDDPMTLHGQFYDPTANASSTTPAFPKTGDGADLMLWAALLLTSVVGMTAMARRKHSRI